MEITVINDIIKKIDVVKGQNGVYLEFSVKRGDDTLCLSVVQSDYIEKVLQLLGKKSLGRVKNVPVRFFGTIEGQTEGKKEFYMKTMAVGEHLENKWLIFNGAGDAIIVDFDTLIEKLGLQEANPVLVI